MTSAPALAAEFGLPRQGGRPTLGAYLGQLWERRHFTFELARSRWRASNEEYRLGIAWVVLLPMINVAVYWLVFGVLVTGTNRPEHFLPFLVVGVFTFQFFSACFIDGAKAITRNRGLVRTLHFPRAVLPLSAVLQQTLSLLPTVAVMCVILVLSGEYPTVHWLKMIPAYGLMALFCCGVAFVAARLTIHLRDITQIIPFVNRLLFYTSGIFFAVQASAFAGQQWIGTLLQWNPINVYITLVRDALLWRDRAEPGVNATMLQWELGIGYGLVLFVFGFIFFWRAEGLYGRD